MREIIDSYRNRRIGFSEMVGELEGALDASEFDVKETVDRWYDLWIPLETLRAVYGDAVDPDDVRPDIQLMDSFLAGVLEEQSHSDV
jgi:hypothetical protein